jgi:predicted transcriptional regulator
VPRNLLKSRDFQEQCILSAIEVLSAHFAQWSYHVSFPDLATIPLILLKRLHEQTTIDSLHRPLKQLIDQVRTVKTRIPVIFKSVSILFSIFRPLYKEVDTLCGYCKF